MKKIRCLLLITLLLCSMLIFPNFTENASAIGQHEASSGTTTGEIAADNIPYTGTHWDISGQSDDSADIATNGTNIWTVDSYDEEVYKYTMAGAYVSSWDTSSQTIFPVGITTDKTNIWIVDFVAEEVYKYTMAGAYVSSWDTSGQGVAPAGITTDGTNIWTVDPNTDEVYKYTMAGAYVGSWDTSGQGTYPGGITTDGTNIWTVDSSTDEVYKYSVLPIFTVTRTVGAAAEVDDMHSFSPSVDCTGNVTLKVPVSTSVKGIIDVTNNTGSILATEVNTTDELVNNTFWYDSANQFVHIRTIDLTTSTTVNWTINCSYGVVFNLIIPPYLEVGQYFHSEGFISDNEGNAISGMIAETRLLYQNGTDALTVNPKHNCTNGNYHCTFSTSILIPGIYSVSIEFTDSDSGITFKEGSTLYLSTSPGSGIYVSSFLHFTFYNNNTGIGILSESFKVYASEDTIIDSLDRIYVDIYNTYTGQTIYYRIDDYFDNQIYPISGNYITLAITDIEQFEDIPIDWYSFSVKNMNHSIVRFRMTNASRTHSQYLYPYEPFYWNVLSGTYTINLTYYNPVSGAVVDYHQENITITDDTYYWITGYDLQDIILEIQITNSSLDALIISVTANVNITDSSINTIITNMVSNLTATETNITNLINSYSANFTIIESLVGYLNNTIWTNISIIDSTVDTINSKLVIDFNLLNVTLDYINNTIWAEFTVINSTVNTITTDILSSLTLSETNITTLTNNLWNAINITDSIVGYINNSIWSELTAIDTVVDNINNNIWTNLTVIESDIGTINIAIHSSLIATETNITNLINSYSANFTIIESVVDSISNSLNLNFTIINTTLNTIDNKLSIDFDLLNSTISYINTSLWFNLSKIYDTVINIDFNLSGTNITVNLTAVLDNLLLLSENLTMINVSIGNMINVSIGNMSDVIVEFWGSVNTSFDTLKNRSTVIFNFYNTNLGLGLDRETMQIYVNGQRLIDNIYECQNGTEMNLTIKDYYNFTMYTNTFTINAPFTFVDLGLTFHSWKFGNKNTVDYMVSLLREGASRWWEVGIAPGETIEFMVPSGNYTVRLYDADYNEIYNVSGWTINNSRVFVIEGSDVYTVISGLSVVSGQILELGGDLAYMFMPDVNIVSRNPPIIFSIYDKEGMAFGGDFYMICPPLITIATTRVTTYGNWINSTAAIPSNGTATNGTVTILRDTLYLSGPGSITWVNITYADNGTVMGNTSYVPSRIDIYGQNLTINASGDISVTRETKYHQVRKFDWTYYPFAGYGPDSDRAGWHTAGIEIINPMSVPLYEVYVIAGFSDESNPDGNSVVVSDTSNAGIILERGPDYDITDTSIHFNLLSLTAYETRAFTIGYYKLSAESYIYDEGTVSIPTYDPTVWNGDSYNTFKAHWSNPYSTTFRGALYIKLNFDVPIGIDTTSMRIYDLTNDHELDLRMFIPGDKYIRICAEAIGDVLPGASRQFDVYFLMEEYAGADPKELHLNTQLWMGVTPFLIIFLLGVGFIILGTYFAASDKKEKKDRWKICVALGIFLIVVIYILNAMGL